MDRGDIFHVDLNPTKGREQAGARYVLIVSPKVTEQERLNDIIQGEGSLTDEDLRAIFEQVHGVDIARAEREEIEEARSVIDAMLDDLGIDIDLSDLRPDMSDEEIAVKAAQIGERLQQKSEEDESEFGRPEPRKTKRQLQQEERMRQAEQLRKKSIASIYKQLAKVLHPDLELDAARRQAKVALMQDLTAAYRSNDPVWTEPVDAGPH